MLLKKEDFMYHPKLPYWQDSLAYREYKKLTDLQKLKIERLKEYEGYKVVYNNHYRYKNFILRAVILKKGEKVLDLDGSVFSFYPYHFYLEINDELKSERGKSYLNGFWSNKIDSIQLIGLEDEYFD